MLIDALDGARDVGAPPLDAHRGTLGGVDVVVATCGVGKMLAAASATAVVERFAAAALVLTGVAGGVDDALGVGDIVVARRVVDTDYRRETDSGPVHYRPGTLPLPSVPPDAGYDLPGPVLAAIEGRLPGDVTATERDGMGPGRVVLGTIASGDVFVASPRYRDALTARWQADVVEMEGAAICGVALRYGLPWLIVRAVSDRAGEDSDLVFESFLPVAAGRSAAVLRALLPAIAEATGPPVSA